MLLLLGVGVFAEVARRIAYGAEPLSSWMTGTALLSLVVNVTVAVLRLLAPLNPQRCTCATWLFTRADVVANIGVIVAGMLVFWFESPHLDFVIGTLIRVCGIKEAIAILCDARRARSQTQPG